MLEDLRRALVLVGVSRTLEDPASVQRAVTAARVLLRRVEARHASTPLAGAQRERVQRGIHFLNRALAAESALLHH
jgi:hypothetical protein